LVKGGAVSAKGGVFYVDEISYGMYYAVVNFVGYQKETVTKVMVSPRSPEVTMDTIWLHQAINSLDAVEIVSERTFVEYKIDRKVVTVGKDLNASGGTAVEALENVPSVQVDVEGNVSLRGSSNFQVLINGKPTPLTGSDALEQIPVSTIKNIEIITNPSAKYDPDGMTGIINVVLKENVISGLSGMIESSIGTNEKYKLNGIVSYRNKKFNAFVGANYRSDYRPGTGHSELENYYDDTTMYRITDLDRFRTHANYSVKVGMDFYLNKRNTWGFEGSFDQKDFTKDFSSTIHEYFDPTVYEQFRVSQNTGGRGGPRFSLSSHWDHDFTKPETTLITTAYYSNVNDEDFDENLEYLSDITYTELNTLLSAMRTEENMLRHDFRLKSDYERKIGEKGKFEAGYQIRMESDDKEFVVSDFDELADTWVHSDTMSADLTFKRNIYALYSTYGNQYKKIGYKVGLRAETTDRLTVTDGEESSKIQGFHLFPSVHLSRDLGKTQQVMLSYSRRVRRPGGWELSPFPMYISSTFMRYGNPDLQPEFISNFDLSYQKRIKSSFVSVEGYYRTAQNKITRINMVEKSGLSVMTFDNLERDIATGVELMGNFNFSKWLNYTISGSVYYYELIGESETQSYDNSSVNYDFRNNLTFRIGSFSRLQLSAFYRGPSATATGNMEAFWMSNATYAVNLFKNKVTLSLRVRDIFETAQHSMETIGPNYYTYNFFNREGRVFYLTASYKLNNYKQKRSGGMQEVNGGDDLF
jgi:outer membrane receptor protein involved in Fe transport